MAKGPLTAKQEAFIREYLVDRNGTAAAERAGYTGDRATLGVTASRLLKDHRVAERLEAKEEKLAEAVGLEAERTLREVAALAYGTETPPPVKAKMLEVAMRYHGLLTEKVQHSGEGGGPVTVELVRYDAKGGA